MMTTDEWCVVVVIVDDDYSSENKESTKNTIHTSPLTSAAVNAIFVDIILIYEWQNLDGIFCYLLLLLDMYTHIPSFDENVKLFRSMIRVYDVL